jgi:hypothetical protein
MVHPAVRGQGCGRYGCDDIRIQISPEDLPLALCLRVSRAAWVRRSLFRFVGEPR